MGAPLSLCHPRGKQAARCGRERMSCAPLITASRGGVTFITGFPCDPPPCPHLCMFPPPSPHLCPHFLSPIPVPSSLCPHYPPPPFPGVSPP